MPLDPFVHLHVHSEFSALDGLSGPYSIVRAAGLAGAPAVALTDHGTTAGVVTFHEATVWFNETHAERHAADACSNIKECHPSSACRGLERCPDLGSPDAEAVHGTLAPIKGIYGLETYVAERGRAYKEPDAVGDRRHLVLLARDEQGWDNLRVLASLASTEGYYHKPRIDMDALADHAGGLIAMSACLGGHLAAVWRRDGEAAADALIFRYQAILGKDNYYLELQWHLDQDPAGADRAHEQWDLNRYLIGAAARTGAHLVVTNDTHYATQDLADLEEILLTIQQGGHDAVQAKRLAGKEVLGFDTPDFYLKDRATMQAALADWFRLAKEHDPELAETMRSSAKGWLDESVVIAERITLAKPFASGKLHFPIFPVPEQFMDASIDDPEARTVAGAKAYLADLTWKGAAERYPVMTDRTRRLIEYELQGVGDMDYAPYFLIVGDYCQWARDHDIDVGLGRGSAPGSIVTYCLGITDLDPVKYGLTDKGIGFTRFLNPKVTSSVPTDAWGDLPAAILSLPAPSAEVMEEEVALALRTRALADRDNAKRRDPDIQQGRVPKMRKDGSSGQWLRWVRYRDLLGEEWAQVKRNGLVEAYWRWLQHTRAGGAPGERNTVFSILARYLDFTTLQVNLLDHEYMPLKPVVAFKSARKGMPDIDTDFLPEGREAVMQYVVAKYGADRVCQIATFGTMLAKSAILDVARAKGLPPGEAAALTLLVPKKFRSGGDDEEDGPGKVTLREMLTSNHPSVANETKVVEMKAAMAADPKVDEIIRAAARLEGVKKSVSTHACGVLITPEPVTNYVAVMKVDKGTGVQAVHDGPTCESMGLLKADFLGLTNLSVNRACQARILERRGAVVRWQDVPDNDEAAMAVFCEGRTEGIFQFSSGFATKILKQFQPTTVDDLSVATALGRPGPMEFIPDYLNGRRKGKPTYDDQTFARFAAPVLDETFGTLVYQEQMMLLAIAVADFSLTDTEGLRKACSKKKLEVLDPFRAQWVAGGIGNGVSQSFLETYWDTKIVPFGRYAFNKSHSRAYSLTSYKQGYLKAHYGPEFAAALMSVAQHEPTKEKGGASPLAKAVAEARRSGYTIGGVDINLSTSRIEIEPDPKHPDDIEKARLRMSLVAAKGIGTKPIDTIVAERTEHGPYTSFLDFMTRMTSRPKATDPITGRTIPNPVNKTIFLGLVRVGAFDAFDDRLTLMTRLAAHFDTTSVRKRAEIDWTPSPDYDRTATARLEDLIAEHEALGFYASGHPASAIPKEAWDQATFNCSDIEEFDAEDMTERRRADRARTSERETLVGIVGKAEWKPNLKSSGGRFVLRAEDLTANCEVLYWQPKDTADSFAKSRFAAFRTLAESGRLVRAGILFRGAPSHHEQFGPKFDVTDWEPIVVPDAPAPATPTVSQRAAARKAAAAKTVDPLAGGDAATGLDDLFSPAA